MKIINVSKKPQNFEKLKIFRKGNSEPFQINSHEQTTFSYQAFTLFAACSLHQKPGSGKSEYACHAGNYALPGILAGARAEEAQQASEAAKAKSSAPGDATQ